MVVDASHPTAVVSRTCIRPSRQEECPFADPRHDPNGCQDAGLRALLVPYAISLCTEDQEIAFESHVLVCDTCFEDLIAIDRASNLLTEHLAER